MRRSAVLAVLIATGMSACSGGGSAYDPAAGTIEVFGPWRGSDADRFAEVLAAFEDESGLDVQYVGSADFVTDLQFRAGEGNDPPDVAIVPQPGVIDRLITDGQIVPLGPDVRDTVVENFGTGSTETATDDDLYAIPYRVTVKSLVWYRPDQFAENGWSIPESIDELDALVASIQASGEVAPWCLGIESGTATGWVATDWTEDLVLRSIGPERYQRWANGEIDFADPDIAGAFDRFRTLALDRGRPLGGVRGVVETPVSEAILPLLTDPAGCALHRQADFAVNWLPEGTSIGPDGDIDFFVLPAATAGESPPLVIGGDQVVQFRTGEDLDELMTFLAGPEAAQIWARRGGFLSGNRQVPDDAYPNAYLQELSAALAAAPALVFDASDQMPPAIGSDLLWERITTWLAGALDYDTFAAEIDEARSAAEASAPPTS